MKIHHFLFIATAILCSCNQAPHKLTAIECGNIKVTEPGNKAGAENIKAILDKYKPTIEQVKAPVIGTSQTELTSYLPESPLMNFAADAIFKIAQREQKTDLALTNKGGLRNTLPKGELTFGDIYNVFPFENRLTFLTLNGTQLMQLFGDIAKVGGEAISGARLTISADGKLIDATVGGKAVNPEQNYRIATLDYLAEGNDKLYTLAKGSDVQITDLALRDLIIQYIAELHSKGESINATLDGRITIK